VVTVRKIDADALEEHLKQRVKKSEQAGDGQAAGMFYCMVLILRHAPTLPEDDAGRDEQRSI
jgi:hypothetical protein